MSPTAYTILASANTNDLVSLINTNPKLETIIQLTDAFQKLSQEHPDKTDVYASALVAARDSGRLSKIDVGEPGEPQEDDFAAVLNRYIYNLLTALLYETLEATINPKNSYLVASLISGAALRTQLCFSSAQIGEITRGLHFSHSSYKSYWGPEKYEVNAVGACIHLLAGGKAIYNGGLVDEVELKQRLGEIGSSISHTIGIKVLEVSTA